MLGKGRNLLYTYFLILQEQKSLKNQNPYDAVRNIKGLTL